MDDCTSNILKAYLDLRFSSLYEAIMSELTPRIDEVVRSFDEKSRTVLAAIAAVRAEVDELKKNAATPEDLAKLDALNTQIDAFDPNSPATLPPEPEPAP